MQDMFFLAIIWSGVFLSYFLAAKTKLTPVLYFLAFGSTMVNMGVLPGERSEFIRGFAEIDYYNQSKIIVDDVAFSWIGSVFFVELGSKIIFDQNIFLSVIPQILSLIIGLLLAQTISASLAARFTGNYE
jgi:hypothetical protein